MNRQKAKSNTNPTKKQGVNSGAHEGLAISASYKTPVVTHTYYEHCI
jgi:hypothetical protein